MNDQQYKVCDGVWECIKSLDIDANVNLKDLNPKETVLIMSAIELLRERLSNIESLLPRSTDIAPTRASARDHTMAKSPVNIDEDKLNKLADKQAPEKIQSNYNDNLKSDNPYEWIIQRYNKEPDKIENEKVGPTEESLNSFMNNSVDELILKKQEDGYFWIIEDNSEELLFPIRGLKISKHNLNAIKFFFKVEGSDDMAESSFSVREPAVVQTNDRIEWKLEKQGELIYRLQA